MVFAGNTNDDRKAGKLAESSRGVDFSDKRSGKPHSSGKSFGGIAVGDVMTDQCDAETTSKRVGLALPETESISYSLGDAAHEAGGFCALLLRKGVRRIAVGMLQDVRSRTMHVRVPNTPRLERPRHMRPI